MFYIISSWFFWHFIEVPKFILIAWKNFLLFNINYFSIPQLIKTYFSHWRRYKESYGRGFDPKRYVEVFIGNLISRTIGAIIRTFTILIGLIFEIFIFIFGILIFLFWISLPIIAIFLILKGAGLF